MWSRSELKMSAKAQLKGRYWNYFGISLIPSIMSSLASIPVMIVFEVLIVSGTLKVFTSSGISEDVIDAIMTSIVTFDFAGASELLASSPELISLINADRKSVV